LSQYIGFKWEKKTLIFESNQRNQTIFLVKDAITWYSALVEDWETIDYFLFFQEIKESPKKMQKLVTDLRSVGSLSWSVSKYAYSFKEEVDGIKRLWKIVPRRYCKIQRTPQWTEVGKTTNWLTIWTTHAMYGWVIMRYTKLSTIVWYKVGSDKSKSLEEEYIVLNSMRVSTILLSVSLTHSKIFVTYFDWERR